MRVLVKTLSEKFHHLGAIPCSSQHRERYLESLIVKKKALSSSLPLKHTEYRVQKIFGILQVFDESLPKRPWDNFHFVEFHELTHNANSVDAGELSFAVQSLLEVPDQYNIIRQMGLLRSSVDHHNP